MKVINHRDDCRLCGSDRLQLVLPIRPSPIGDAFVPGSKLELEQNLYPLDTHLCMDCGHLQNIDVVHPEILFREYTYRSSVSLGLVEHFKKYAETILNKLSIPENSLIIEIGSNDGSLLKVFKSKNYNVLGIDPAKKIAQEATAEGINTIPNFFSLSLAMEIKKLYGPASLFCANNVFAHIDDISEVVSGISHLLSPDGVFVFEVSYVPLMIQNMVFDVIYHEHVSHHSLLPLEKFLNKHGMALFDVEFIHTKGGSMRAYAQLIGTGRNSKTDALIDAYENEQKLGICSPQIYQEFFKKIEIEKRKLQSYLSNYIKLDRTIAAYGASTTTTTLLYHFELENNIQYIFDDNPLKHGLYSPRSHIPVIDSCQLKSLMPDLVIILAWIYADEIIKKNMDYVESGGKFVVPLPKFRIVEKA